MVQDGLLWMANCPRVDNLRHKLTRRRNSFRKGVTSEVRPTFSRPHEAKETGRFFLFFFFSCCISARKGFRKTLYPVQHLRRAFILFDLPYFSPWWFWPRVASKSSDCVPTWDGALTLTHFRRIWVSCGLLNKV